MTAKRVTPKPEKNWGVYRNDGSLAMVTPYAEEARADVRFHPGGFVHRVLITPIEPKKRGKK